MERHRLRRRLARFQEAPDPIPMLLSLLRLRGQKVMLSVAPDDLPELRRDPRLRPSGISHPEAGLLAPDLEAYVATDELPGLLRNWFLVPAAPGARSNVVIRAAQAVPETIPSLAVAVDLAEHGGVREQQAAQEIIARLRGR